MPPIRTGIHTSHQIVLEAIDATGASVILVGVQGDPSFGDELPDQRTQTDVFERGLQLGRVQDQEQPLSISWSVLDCAEARAFVDWVLFRSSPLASTTDPIGGKALKLRATTTPTSGTPRQVEYARTYWTCSPAGGIPAVISLSCEAYGRTET